MMKRVLAYLTVLLAILSSCTSSFEEKEAAYGMDPALEGKPVTVTFSIPAVRLASMTKGVEGAEGDITASPYLDPDKLYLVDIVRPAFSSWQFCYFTFYLCSLSSIITPPHVDRK